MRSKRIHGDIIDGTSGCLKFANMIRSVPKLARLDFLHFFMKEHAHVNFLFSMVLLVALGPFLEAREASGIWSTTVSTYNVLATMYFIIHDKRNYLVVLISAAVIFMDWSVYFGWPTEGAAGTLGVFHMLSNFGVPIIFLWALIKLFTIIFYARQVDLNVIVSSISGYLALGLIGAFAFDILNEIWPKLFIVSGIEGSDRHTMTYFSFVTLSTLGYGDMVPQTPLARGLAILLTVAGQMYMTMVIALLIGKFLAARKTK